MKENRYDDEMFFEKYSQMSRSKQGLDGAGEWQELKKLLPDFRGKRVLDLGCGYGWHCIYAAQSGAAFVQGTDISEKMLEVAREKTAAFEKETAAAGRGVCQIVYQCGAMEDLSCEPGSFDVVISSLAFHYVRDFGEVVEKIGESLSDGGWFVFSVEHPVFTAYGTQDWYYDEKGNILHFPVDNYYYEGKREAVFLGEKVVKYHRTLTAYLDTLLKNGFAIRRIVEPMPPESMRDIPGMMDEMRRPMMLLVAAQKEGKGCAEKNGK